MALDRASGDVAWSHDTALDGPAAQFHGEILLDDGELLLVGADARPTAFVYAFERATGRVRWKQAFPGGVATDLLRHGGAVLGVSMVAGEVFALDAATGEPLWRVDDPPPGWDGQRQLDAVLAGELLIVPSREGVVDAYRAATGERLWRRDLGATLTTAPLPIGEDVWIGTGDGRLLSFAAGDGTAARTVQSRGFFYGDLVPAGGCVVALRAEGGGAAGGLAGPHAAACIDLGSGEEHWRHASPDEWGSFRPLVARGAVIVGRDGEVLALAADDGAVLWRLAVPGLPRGLGHAPGTLYVGTLQGRVSAHPWP